MEIKKPVRNGFIFRNEETNERFVLQIDTENDEHNIVNFLYDIMENIGYVGSDKECIRIIIVPVSEFNEQPNFLNNDGE